MPAPQAKAETEGAGWNRGPTAQAKPLDSTGMWASFQGLGEVNETDDLPAVQKQVEAPKLSISERRAKALQGYVGGKEGMERRRYSSEKEIHLLFLFDIRNKANGVKISFSLPFVHFTAAAYERLFNLWPVATFGVVTVRSSKHIGSSSPLPVIRTFRVFPALIDCPRSFAVWVTYSYTWLINTGAPFRHKVTK